MATKVLTGARAKIYVNNVLIGIFETCTYNMSIGTEPIHLLGRYSAAEITPTSYEAVTLSCSGFRVIGAGPYGGSPSAVNPSGQPGESGNPLNGPSVYMLQDLLNLTGVTIAIVDRQTGVNILTAMGCVATGYNGNHNARATSRITINYTGLVLSDESGNQSEGTGAVDLP
jgi:hypothetical protein